MQRSERRDARTPRVAAVVLLGRDGAALLQHRDEKPGLKHAGKWVPPGGHCEPGETIDGCARREFQEETAYRLDDLHFLLEFVDDEDATSPVSHVTVFWSLYDGVQSFECREGQALAFIDRSQSADYPIPAYLVEVWDRAVEATRSAGRLRA